MSEIKIKQWFLWKLPSDERWIITHNDYSEFLQESIKAEKWLFQHGRREVNLWIPKAAIEGATEPEHKTVAHFDGNEKPWCARLSWGGDPERVLYCFRETSVFKNGDLEVLYPVEGFFYAYGITGQEQHFVTLRNGEFVEVSKEETIAALKKKG